MLLNALVMLLLLGLTKAQNATEPAVNATERATTEAATQPSTGSVTVNATEGATTEPPPDSLSVKCTTDGMMVTLDIRYHPNIAVDKVTLSDANCKLADLGDLNATHISLNAPLDSCMTNHTTDGDNIIYQNRLVTETRESAGAAIISREFQAEFPFKCTYPRSAIVSVASFSPREKVIYTRTAEYGNFTFTMDMYETDAYETPYADYPVRVDLNEPMYLEVQVKSNDSMLVLIPVKCWGTAEPEPDDDKSYAFIDNGCGKDETLDFDYELSAVQRFQLDAFRFLGESADAVVYLHCSVEACRSADNDSRCAEGCTDSARRKRRGAQFDAITEETVTIGPVGLERKSAARKQQKSASSLTIFAAVAGVLAVVVFALVVALVILYKRYRNPQTASRVVYTKTSSDDNKQLV